MIKAIICGILWCLSHLLYSGCACHLCASLKHTQEGNYLFLSLDIESIFLIGSELPDNADKNLL